MVTTTHFLKKCILVPSRQNEQEEKYYLENPFKRGSMKFDDFNYEVFNPYILIQEQKKEGEDKEAWKNGSVSTEVMKGLINPKGPTLSKQALEMKQMDNYDFKSITCKTPDNKGDEALADLSEDKDRKKAQHEIKIIIDTDEAPDKDTLTENERNKGDVLSSAPLEDGAATSPSKDEGTPLAGDQLKGRNSFRKKKKS